jgi:hypothetical protein
MGVDVTIRNRKLIKRPLTIADVAGSNPYGHADEYFRLEDGLIQGTNIVYDKRHIGRGFEFDWTGDDRNEISLRLNFLSTNYDIHLFYATIRNIMTIWGAKEFTQDGSNYRLSDLDDCEAGIRQDNTRYLSEQKERAEEFGNTIILGAINPVVLECNTIAEFADKGDLEGYATLLHNTQAQDLYYAVPRVYRKGQGAFFGNYAVTATADAVFPLKASEPILFKNPDTGEDLKCDFFSVSLCSLEKDAIVARISFDDFKKEVDLESMPRYDAEHVILRDMTEERIAAIVAKNYPDPVTSF